MANIEERAISLLGSGVTAEATAAALGVTPARISQLLAREDFSEKVTALRYENLQSHNKRDSRYDALEDKLLDKLDDALPMMYRPAEILKSIQIINAAKRRGQSSPEQVTASQHIVSLVLPTKITQQFTTNIHNQIVTAGTQSLETMQASNLLDIVEGVSENTGGAESDKVQTDSTDLVRAGRK